jgi:hypothetical protein
VNGFYLILAASPLLILGVTVFLVLIARGIRRGDRAYLGDSSGRRLDSITRRVLGVGVRANSDDEDR